jgi:hypothetical protein
MSLIQLRAQNSIIISDSVNPRDAPTSGEPMVPRGRVELPLSYENRILSPARLPVPPSGHAIVKGACF